jgi:predicted acetyltransferase
MSKEMRKHIDTFKKFTLNETFFDLDKEYKINLNSDNNIKKEFNFSTLSINKDNKLKTGFNKIYIDDNEVGSFVVEKFGNIKDIHNKKTYTNSLFLQGGFIIKKENKKSGVGRETIKKIFNDYKQIDNILLYAIDWQGAVGFWTKIGGEIIYRNDESGLNFIKINRNTLK